MSTHKKIDKICCVVLVFAIIVTIIYMNASNLGVKSIDRIMEYETTLFDTSKVHTIDIITDDWDSFIKTASDKEYINCNVVIDGKAVKNVGLRAKGNSSLSMVASSDSDRYSFKIEFDHYKKTQTYKGLDKLCLNNIIQDNTYMKDFLSYQLMNDMGVASPLCSYIDVSVNGEDFGLYLAVEALEQSFLQRNYGTDYGALYKPETEDRKNKDDAQKVPEGIQLPDGMTPPEGIQPPDDTNSPERMQPPDGMMNNQNMKRPEGNTPDDRQPDGAGINKGNMSSDTALNYVDDNISSYSYIFDNAVTKVSKSDKNRVIKALKNISEQEDIEDSVNVDEVIRYFVVHNFLLNFDSYTGSIMHNYYLYEDNGQLTMLPWDYNLSFNSFMTNYTTEELVNFPIDTPVSTGTTDSRPMLDFIFKNEDYTDLYHNVFNEFISNEITSGKYSELITNTKNLISPYVEKDPTKFCSYDEFILGVDTLKQFIELRGESIADQLDGKIGITAQEQEQNSERIECSDIDVKAMGSENMNKPMGTERPDVTQNTNKTYKTTTNKQQDKDNIPIKKKDN